MRVGVSRLLALVRVRWRGSGPSTWFPAWYPRRSQGVPVCSWSTCRYGVIRMVASVIWPVTTL